MVRGLREGQEVKPVDRSATSSGYYLCGQNKGTWPRPGTIGRGTGGGDIADNRSNYLHCYYKFFMS